MGEVTGHRGGRYIYGGNAEKLRKTGKGKCARKRKVTFLSHGKWKTVFEYCGNRKAVLKSCGNRKTPKRQ